MIENIRKVGGGYILETTQENIFPNFNELVQYLARYFDEVEIGRDWTPLEKEK